MQGEEAQPYLEAVLTARLANTLYRQVSKEDKYEAARNETVLSIAQWVKDHPRATQVPLLTAHWLNQHRQQDNPFPFQAQTQEEVARQIELFKQKIESF